MTYFIRTFGCQMNASDSERIASLLEEIGYRPASSLREADLVVFNLCSVRQTAVDRIYGQFNPKSRLKETKNKRQKVFITGCVLPQDKEKLQDKVEGVFNIRDLDKNFKKVARKFFEKNSLTKKEKELLDKNRDLEAGYLKIKPKYRYSDQAFVPIMTGCDNFCSYCVVPYTRGREWSRPVEDIVKEVEGLAENGCKEVVLLGQNVNSYRSQLKVDKDKVKSKRKIIDFADLLKILNDLPGDFQISFLTNHPKDMSDKLIKTIANLPKVKKHIHLPLQSGDDEILKKMNRQYTQKDYLNLIKKIKKEISGVTLSTDVIVGFPGETEEQFQQTVKVIKEVGFSEVFINKYSPRPGTLAYKKYQDDIPWEEKKRRWRIIAQLFKENK